MADLKQRVKQFQDKVYPGHKSLFEKLRDGQAPEILLITCSDSRIAPHMITSSGPGEIFVIRNAGNVVTPCDGECTGEAATIEYAVSALGVKHIVICGHSGCGAMDALSKGPDACGLPVVADWLRVIERGFSQSGFDTSKAAGLDELIKMNVLVQLAMLRKHPAVASALTSGNVELHGWVYDIGSGVIHACDADGNFAPLTNDGDSQDAASGTVASA